ncbi:alpha/beta fold hydrolase [Phormidium tenue]|uniref:Alpha/beta hydrolase n=1 Tax=Phormidium tenue NIES-30 TaxID=549789 RepID=A0A1U7J6U8_9CYAN|nr:alpha/beta hydrolase [Phormidium tenue]MBD2233516.1 alpha/beta hydrolase [Phormidium tenue FACHB-1052]OKH48627.1 alpha/beta hydrolase [Phormidium tenue NIES-30]
MRSIPIATTTGSIEVLVADAATETSALPAVFIHGMACAADLWRPQLEQTAQQRTAIAISLPGHGASTPPTDDDYSPAACANALFVVLDALQLESILLVGHSYGSCVALAAAAAQPCRIAKLILVDPPIDSTQCPPEVYGAEIAPMQQAMVGEDWRSVLEQSFRNALTGGTPETQTNILARLNHTPKAALVGTGRELFTFEAAAALDRYLASPGAQAHAIVAASNAMPLSLHVLRPMLPTTTIPNTSHWLMLDAPEAFSQALEAVL